MLRVLHLTPFHADYETAAGVRALLSDSAHSFTADVRRFGQGSTLPLPLAGALRLRWRRELDPFDLIHAWGVEALTIAALGSRTSLPIVYNPTSYPSVTQIRWLNAVMSYRDVNVVCPTDTMRRRFVERGVPIARCHLVRPGVDFSKVRRRRDDALRAKLGFTPDDRVTLAVGESTRSAAHDVAAFSLAVMHVMDPHNRLLVWGRGPLTDKLRRFTRRLKDPSTVIATEMLGVDVPFESLFPAVDDVLITADGPVSTLPIATCMAAGLPIVTTVTPTVAELLEDRHTALMVTRPTAKLIAQRLIDLRDDPNLQWSIADKARTEAFDFFAQSRFVEQFRSVYAQAAKQQPVELPALRAGAGTRFHGRA